MPGVNRLLLRQSPVRPRRPFRGPTSGHPLHRGLVNGSVRETGTESANGTGRETGPGSGSGSGSAREKGRGRERRKRKRSGIDDYTSKTEIAKSQFGVIQSQRSAETQSSVQTTVTHQTNGPKRAPPIRP